MESSPSGLWRRLGKAVGLHRPRGFKSLTLRQPTLLLRRASAYVITSADKSAGKPSSEDSLCLEQIAATFSLNTDFVFYACMN